MKYALIENDLVVEVRDMPVNFDPATVAHKFDARPVNDLVKPAIDPATQKYGVILYTVNPADVDATLEVLAKTQEEQDAYTQNQLDETERAQAKAVYQDLKDGTGTQLERLVRAERVAARLLRDAYGV